MNNLNNNLASLVMVQGVSANAGKSVITKSLGRYYANLGYNVTTFKPVQVCLDKVVSNGVVTDIRMEASLKACRQPVSQHNNPIKIFPKHTDPYSNILSPALMSVEDEEPFEVELLGRDTPLYNKLSDQLRDRVTGVIDSHLKFLMEKHQIVIIEGAGNPTDLGKIDLTNYYIATNFPVSTLLVTKLSSGGAAASLLGTYSLLAPSIKKTVKGYILNDYIGGLETVKNIEKLISSHIDINYLGMFPHVWKDIVNLNEQDQLDYLANIFQENISIYTFNGLGELNVN